MTTPVDNEEHALSLQVTLVPTRPGAALQYAAAAYWAKSLMRLRISAVTVVGVAVGGQSCIGYDSRLRQVPLFSNERVAFPTSKIGDVTPDNEKRAQANKKDSK